MSVIIEKGKVGANTISSGDGISAMLMHGVAASGLELGVVKEFRQLKDAEELGITAEYDSTNNIRVWYNIKEFYRKPNNRGTKLFIMLVNNSIDGSNECVVNMEDMLEDTGGLYAKKLANEAIGEIKLFGVVLNPATGYVSTILNGMDADVFNSIAKAQAFVEWTRTTHKMCNVILEGREFTGTAAAAQDLRAIANTEADYVSLSILQDYDYAEGLDDLGKKHASVGTVLGAAASVSVEKNMGALEDMDIADTATGDFVTPGISSHIKAKDIQEDWGTLDSKGYIFPTFEVGYNGVYLNNDHTCTPVKKDSEGNINAHQLSYGRAESKAVRKLRTAMLPKVKSTHQLDAATGKLPAGKVKLFEAEGNNVFEQMSTDGEISGGQTYVDPESDLISIPRILDVDYAFAPVGTIDQIKGNINIKTSI